MRRNAKKLLAATFIVAVTCTTMAHAQSPAGEPPYHVRNGVAKKLGHLDSKQMLRLAFGLQPPHHELEEEFLKQLMTPGSPEYRHFLTQEEWNARFAPSALDEQAVIDWARSNGFTVTQRYPNRLIVDVEAPVAVIENALHVTISSYTFEGYTYFANEHEPQLPSSLSTIIRSVGGLHNFPQMNPSAFHVKQPPGPICRHAVHASGAQYRCGSE